MIVFSIDIDWAPDEVVAETLQLFEKYGARATIFATHCSEVLFNCNRDIFELGLHLNFDPLLCGAGGNIETVIDELWAEYPEAKGVRCHCLLSGTRLSEAFARRGIVYESNLFMPYMRKVYPLVHWTGLVSIPHVWEDDVHFRYGRDFHSSGIDLDMGSVQVFTFHPVHVFLNTENSEGYEAARTHYHEPAKLKQHPITGRTPERVTCWKNMSYEVNEAGFTTLTIGPEGSLNPKGVDGLRSFYEPSYLGNENVYEVLAVK